MTPCGFIRGTFQTAAASMLLMASLQTGAARALTIGFTDAYAPANWTILNTNTDGGVNTSGIPASIIIDGGDNSSNLSGSTKFTISAPASGLVTFDWVWSTTDLVTSTGFNDPFYILINGNQTNPLNPNDTLQNGIFSFNVNAGDEFGFEIATADNTFGNSQVTISNFSAPSGSAAPADVPGPLPVIGAAAAFHWGRRLRKRMAPPRPQQFGL